MISFRKWTPLSLEVEHVEILILSHIFQIGDLELMRRVSRVTVNSHRAWLFLEVVIAVLSPVFLRMIIRLERVMRGVAAVFEWAIQLLCHEGANLGCVKTKSSSSILD